MRKPVRKVRRFIKRKCKGKGKHPGFYLASLNDQELEEFFFKALGKVKEKAKGQQEKVEAGNKIPRALMDRS